MNTASQEVLTALGFTTAQVTAIIAAQPLYSSSDPPDPIYQTPTWLITNANITPANLVKLEPYISTRTQVYRVQSIGYSDVNKGQAVRVEAVIDANYIPSGNGVGQPRILSWRVMDDFGKIRPPTQ